MVFSFARISCSIFFFFLRMSCNLEDAVSAMVSSSTIDFENVEMILGFTYRLSKYSSNSEKSDDDKNGWTEPRGRTLLSYLDFDDLKILIIQNDNWLLFEKDFPSQDFIKIRLQELYQIRNKIAHNANITQQEFDMLKMYSTQIYTQLKKYDDEIKLIEL